IGMRASVVVSNSGAAFIGKEIVGTTPIVFTAGDDPAKSGLVSSLSRPGGTVTGVSFYDVPLAAKRLGLLLDLVPGATTVAAIVDPGFGPSVEEVAGLQAAAAKIRQRLILMQVRENEIETALAEIARSGASALHIGSGPLYNAKRERIAAL